jgi:hypothetical protein
MLSSRAFRMSVLVKVSAHCAAVEGWADARALATLRFVLEMDPGAPCGSTPGEPEAGRCRLVHTPKARLPTAPIAIVVRT